MSIQTELASLRPTQPSVRYFDKPSAPTESGSASKDWDQFLTSARQIQKTDLTPSPFAERLRAPQPAYQGARIKQAVLLIPSRVEPGVQLAIQDLVQYLSKVTGKPVLQLPLGSDLSKLPSGDVTAIAIGQGQPYQGLVPPASGRPEGYTIQGKEVTLGGRKISVIGLNGDDLAGQQYAIYRLMELSGKRFFSYTDTYNPPAEEALFPIKGFYESQAPTAQMKIRGFAPHTYHPIPLSTAFHDPSPEHLAMMKRYIDWCVQNRQNYLMFPLLELDATNPYLPLRGGESKFQAWIPHAREIVKYAHQRGIQVSIKVAFANYVSANAYAINPVEAMWQSFRLGRKQDGVQDVTDEAKALREQLADVNAKIQVAPKDEIPALFEARRKLLSSLTELNDRLKRKDEDYQGLLNKFADQDEKKIQSLIDRLMQVPWDEIAWNTGTSEFTPTNDDLTIAWMNDAAAYVKEHYPEVRITVRSHVPRHPHSEKYQDAYFNLVRFTDPDVGALIHTTHAYALTDPAPVYGNQDFTHKLKQLYESSPERHEVYYPETSYWVSHDTTVPLFLPVYILNRRHDIEIIKPLEHLDGHVDFTTAWEWGYWLNDYAVAQMQFNPNQSLTEILNGAFVPFGSAKTAMVRIMNAAMQDQQTYLISKGLIRHLQGFDTLSDLGALASQHPVLKNLLGSANNIPVRLKPKDILGYTAEQLAEFERGELADLQTMTERFNWTLTRIEAQRARIPAEGLPYFEELADGFRINALRARQSLDVLSAAVYARRAKLEGDKSLEAQGKAFVEDARRVVDEAMQVIRKREQQYREAPEYTYEEGRGQTMWSDRYLTRVHTGEYWLRSLKEAEELF